MTTLFSFLFLFSSLLNPNPVGGGLKVGDKAPAISGVDVRGVAVKWDELLKKGPVVVVFYRGGWCPYCNLYLASLVKEMEAISKLGTVVAITVQKPDKIEETIAGKKISFPVLFDASGDIVKSYRAVSDKAVPPKSTTGDYQVPFLPVPATFIVGSDGIISKRHFDEDYKNRMEVPALLAELKRLARK